MLQAGMQNNLLASLTRLSDDDLVARLKGLVARDHDLTAQIVAHLAELDTRDVFLREGYGSLFVYCRDALGLSEWEAYNRTEVARAARRYPVILDMLAEGSVNLTAVRLLAPHLTPGNHCEVLDAARGKRKPEVEEIVARLSPRPDVPASVRRLPTSRPATVPLAAPAPASASPAAPPVSVPIPEAGPAAHPLPVGPVAVTPLSPDRYKLQLTISGDTLEKLRPSAQVKRAVWLRDLRRCTFVGTNSHRCNERRFIEFHHIDPHVLGGEATVDQIQLRCRCHNDYEGRLYFGKRRRRGDGGSTPGELVLEQVAPLAGAEPGSCGL